jgi:hypothetical protein
MPHLNYTVQRKGSQSFMIESTNYAINPCECRSLRIHSNERQGEQAKVSIISVSKIFIATDTTNSLFFQHLDILWMYFKAERNQLTPENNSAAREEQCSWFLGGTVQSAIQLYSKSFVKYISFVCIS